MPLVLDPRRRQLLKLAGLAIAAAPLGAPTAAIADNAADHRSEGGSGARAQAAFGPLKHIPAGVLNVGYVDAGPAQGPVVILLHGWPYDIHAFVEVVPILAGKGFRVIVPHLRGYGDTRFVSDDTPRNGQQAALAVDVIELMDALKIERAVIGGFDWGARTANIVAAQ